MRSSSSSMVIDSRWPPTDRPTDLISQIDQRGHKTAAGRPSERSARVLTPRPPLSPLGHGFVGTLLGLVRRPTGIRRSATGLYSFASYYFPLQDSPLPPLGNERPAGLSSPTQRIAKSRGIRYRSCIVDAMTYCAAAAAAPSLYCIRKHSHNHQKYPT